MKFGDAVPSYAALRAARAALFSFSLQLRTFAKDGIVMLLPVHLHSCIQCQMIERVSNLESLHDNNRYRKLFRSLPLVRVCIANLEQKIHLYFNKNSKVYYFKGLQAETSSLCRFVVA